MTGYPFDPDGSALLSTSIVIGGTVPSTTAAATTTTTTGATTTTTTAATTRRVLLLQLQPRLLRILAVAPVSAHATGMIAHGIGIPTLAAATVVSCSATNTNRYVMVQLHIRASTRIGMVWYY